MILNLFKKLMINETLNFIYCKKYTKFFLYFINYTILFKKQKYLLKYHSSPNFWSNKTQYTN